MVDTLKEAEAQIREAMKPPQINQGNGFSPGIQGLRLTANKRKLNRQLPRTIQAR